MNGPLFDDLLDQLRGGPVQELGSRLGVAPDSALQAVTAAMPLLFAALHRNASGEQGASSLFSALEMDHRGVDPSNALSTALAGGGSGAGILRHLFGDREPVAAQTVGSVTGLDEDRGGLLLRTLAPAVMAYLARRVFAQRGTDGASTPEASPQGLRNALSDEVASLRTREGFGGGLLDVLDELDEPTAVGTGDEGLASAGTPLTVRTAEMRSPRPLL